MAMLGPNELLLKVLGYVQKHEHQGRFIMNKDKIWWHIIKIDPQADKRSMNEIINELDARGWLLSNSETEIELDPAVFI